MKTIVAATDFSRASRNAVNYAAELAVTGKMQLVLIHVSHPPVMVNEGYVVMPGLEEIRKDGLKRLKRLAAALRAQHGSKLLVSCVSLIGLAADELRLYTMEHATALVVMGMAGAGALQERFMGSVTTALIRRSKVPVLSVRHNQKFTKVKKIILATDYREIKSPAILAPLREFALERKAGIKILHVFSERNKVPSISEAYEGLKLAQGLKGVKHSFHAVSSDNIVEGINQFAAGQKADLIVMIPRKHTIFETLVRPRASKTMAFHASLPLMTINEK